MPAEELTRAVDALAAAIRTARADAAVGDVFCPGVARVFRGHIAATLAAGGNTVTDLLAERDDEEQFGLGAIEINRRFPNGRAAAMWPVSSCARCRACLGNCNIDSWTGIWCFSTSTRTW